MVDDPYIWMENLNDSRVLDFVNRENERFREFVGDLPEKLAPSIKKYFFVTELLSAQLFSKGFFALFRYKDKYLLKRFFFGEEGGEVVLDSKDLGKDAMLVGFKYFEPENILSYWVSFAGSDFMVIKIVDLDSGDLLDELKGYIWNIIFLSKNRFYYTKLYRTEKAPDGVDPPASRVLLREDGEDAIVFGEGLPTNHFIMLKESLDRSKMLVNVTYGWSSGKIFGGDISNPESWRLLYESKGSLPKIVDFVGGYYYFISYGDGGMGSLVRVGEDGSPETVVPEDKYPLNMGIAVGDEILLEYLVDAVSVVKSYNIRSGEIREVFGREYYTYYFHDSNGSRALINRTTFWIPYQLILYEDGVAKVVMGEEIEGSFEVSEGFVRSHDGEKIHYFEVRKKGASGKVAYVTGYGGFAISITPSYVYDLMKLVEDGYVLVITNLRGGLEYGERWHRAGMLLNKMNVFYDYISVLEEFKKRGYKVIASGRSNGGLLVGATLNMRPDVVDAALIGYPVLDMLRFHKLYIGRAWVPEYGDPDNPEHREYLRKYSPYHNIDPNKKYPPTLVYTGLHDDRVHPAHALKYVAKMREIGAPVYLRVETKSGHIGAMPETRLRERADLLAFIYKALGIKK